MGIRLPLLVGGAVCQGDEREALPLVEPASLYVPLEGPEIQLGLRLLRNGQQCLPHAPAMPGGIDVEVIEPARTKSSEAGGPPFGFGQPDRA